MGLVGAAVPGGGAPVLVEHPGAAALQRVAFAGLRSGRDDLPVDLTDLLRIDLDLPTVVRPEPVQLVLQIADLGVDGAGQFGTGCREVVRTGVVDVLRGEGRLVRDTGVDVGRGSGPHVTGCPQREAAVLTVHRGAALVRERRVVVHVVVVVDDLALSGIPLGVAAVDAAVCVDDPGRVERLDVLGDAAGLGPVPLAPALVEDDPAADRGRVVELLHHLLALGEEGVLAGVVVDVGVDEVLPHQQPEPVGVVVPARRLHLDVLAYGVEAEVLLRLQVEGEGGVAGLGVQPVGPEPLVEHGEREERLAVEDELRVAADPVDLQLPHAEVAFDPVLGPAVGERDVEVVQVGVVRRPQALVLDRQAQLAVGGAADRSDDLAPAVAGDGRDPGAGGRLRAVDGDGETARVDVRGGGEGVDGGGRHRFHPDGLPDAGGRGVDDAAGVGGLLALGLVRPGPVGDRDDDLLRAAVLQRVGDVGAEPGVTAGVFGDFGAVDPDGGPVVDGVEVELQPLVPAVPAPLASLADAPALRHGDELAVEHVVLVALQAGELRFDRERHDDPLVELLAEDRLLALGGTGELPGSVEVLPPVADLLRAWVLGQRVVPVQLVAPGGGEAVGGEVLGGAGDLRDGLAPRPQPALAVVDDLDALALEDGRGEVDDQRPRVVRGPLHRRDRHRRGVDLDLEVLLHLPVVRDAVPERGLEALAVLRDAEGDRVHLEVGGRGERGLGNDLLRERGRLPAEEHARAADVLEHLQLEVVLLPRLQGEGSAALLLVPVRLPVVDDNVAVEEEPEAVVPDGVEGVVAVPGRFELPGPPGRRVLGPAGRGLEGPGQPGEVDLGLQRRGAELGEVTGARGGHPEVLAPHPVDIGDRVVGGEGVSGGSGGGGGSRGGRGDHGGGDRYEQRRSTGQGPEQGAGERGLSSQGVVLVEEPGVPRPGEALHIVEH